MGPQTGALDVRDLRLRYREDQDLVLRGITFQMCAGERIGVVGRTGAGKSSLLVALFRIVEPEPDSLILLDGHNVLELGLKDLRCALAMIPLFGPLWKRLNLQAGCTSSMGTVRARAWKAC